MTTMDDTAPAGKATSGDVINAFAVENITCFANLTYISVVHHSMNFIISVQTTETAAKLIRAYMRFSIIYNSNNNYIIRMI